jgi:Zn-dependent protease
VSANRPDLAAVRICADCRSELAPTFLACPRCGRLVHGETLKGLAADGDAAERAGDLGRALGIWRQALGLLPVGSGQHTRINEKVQALSAQVPAPAAGFARVAVAAPGAAAASGTMAAPGGANQRTGWRKWAAGAGAFGIALMKFKWILLFLLTKAKVLLVGLTQAKTFVSMAIALGVYATIYGWQFALGLVVSIYIHEMGHVVWLRRYGIPATAPMFIPGLGAFVRLKAHPATAGEDARVGLAGPVWGAAAAVLALAVGVAFGRPILFAIARVGAWINVFNLVPIWQLDGGRGFAALSRRQRGMVAAVAWVLALARVDGVYFLVAIAATFRAASTGTAPTETTTAAAPARAAPQRGDGSIFLTYVGLLAGLAAIMVGAGKI